MPSYDFICKKCEYEFEVQLSYKEYDEYQKCPFCQEAKGDIFFQAISCPNFFIKQEPTTVGWQAERNTERMSKDELKEKTELKKDKMRRAREEMAAKVGGELMKAQPKEQTPAWRKKLDLNKITNIKKYIETGAT